MIELVQGSGVCVTGTAMQLVQRKGHVVRDVVGVRKEVDDGAVMARALLSEFFLPSDLINATLRQDAGEGQHCLNPTIIESIVGECSIIPWTCCWLKLMFYTE